MAAMTYGDKLALEEKLNEALAKNCDEDVKKICDLLQISVPEKDAYSSHFVSVLALNSIPHSC